jgi:hypothetical protein
VCVESVSATRRDAALRQIDDGGELGSANNAEPPRAGSATFMKALPTDDIGDLELGMASQHEIADIPPCISHYFACKTANT